MTHYDERVSSRRTEALFLVLVLLFAALSLRRGSARRAQGARRNRLTTLFAAVSIFFLFYALNYRTLIIQLSPDTVTLRFGIFTWKIAMANVDHSFLDETSLWRIGGAGIHFSPIKGRYRAMFNVLEYPRVVVALKKKHGLVRDIAFSTRQPEQVLAFIRQHTEEI